MMRELLRVSMNERQVKQACEDWARSRSRADGAAAHVVILTGDLPLSIEVVFTKKRERKAKLLRVIEPGIAIAIAEKPAE